jgi:hypothetical protein
MTAFALIEHILTNIFEIGLEWIQNGFLFKLQRADCKIHNAVLSAFVLVFRPGQNCSGN